MKARVATLLSLTGVLVAGSAAALVNTQVLRNSAPSSNTVAQLIEAENVEPVTTIEVVTTPAPSSSVTTTSVAPDDQKVYEIENTGRVTLDKSDDVLRIVSVEPIAPWQSLSQRQIDALNVEVRFVDGDAIVVFNANLLFDEITYSVRLDSLSTPTSTDGSTVTTAGEVHSTTPNTVSTTPTSTKGSGSNTTTSVDDNGGGGGGGGGGDGGGGGGSDDDQPTSDD